MTRTEPSIAALSFGASGLAYELILVNDGSRDATSKIMADFAATINQAYFAGDWDTIFSLKDGKGWELWRTKALGSFWYTYIWSIFEAY